MTCQEAQLGKVPLPFSCTSSGHGSTVSCNFCDTHLQCFIMLKGMSLDVDQMGLKQILLKCQCWYRYIYKIFEVDMKEYELLAQKVRHKGACHELWLGGIIDTSNSLLKATQILGKLECFLLQIHGHVHLVDHRQMHDLALQKKQLDEADALTAYAASHHLELLRR